MSNVLDEILKALSAEGANVECSRLNIKGIIC